MKNMKKAKKILILALCALLLVGATIAGTVAYLTSTDSVENTFTVGNVAITMVESVVDEYGAKTSGTTDTGNTYKLIPGHEYTKDPTIKVSEGSEDCYIFVEIDNGLGADAALTMSADWAKVSKTENKSVWVYGTAAEPVPVGAENDAVVPFTAFTFGEEADPAAYSAAKITVTAYAIQADGLDAKTAAELWALF